MILVDTALKMRAAEGKPISVGIIGAGFMSQGLTNQIVHSTCGMRVVAISNRKLNRAVDVFRYAGFKDVAIADMQGELDNAIRANNPVATEDAFLLARSRLVDVLVDVTGSVEFGARVIMEAFKHGKDVVLMNAEIDATIGPILQVYAKKHGVILSACDGDEPGVQMNLFRWVKGLRPDSASSRQCQRLARPLSEPNHSEGFCGEVAPEPGYGDKFRRRYQNKL